MLAPKAYARSGNRSSFLEGAMAAPQDGAPLPQPQFRTKGSALFAGGKKRQILEQRLGEVPAGVSMPGQQPALEEPAQSSEVLPALPQSGPLGGSMREPFNYDAAMKALVGEYKKPNGWQIAAAIVGDAITSASGGNPYAVQNMVNRRDAYSQRQFEAAQQIMKWQQGDYAAQRDADLRAANPFTIGRDRLQFDPSTGETRTLYDGAEDFEEYAGSLGMQPGTPEYFQAVEDYVLRSAGPSAHERDLELDDYRTENDVRMEGVRQSNRIGMENLRQRNRTGLEGVRQQNRMDLRQTPTAPRAAATRPTGTGDGLPTVSSPSEAAKLPSGTRFRTPDGRIKVVP